MSLSKTVSSPTTYCDSIVSVYFFLLSACFFLFMVMLLLNPSNSDSLMNFGSKLWFGFTSSELEPVSEIVSSPRKFYSSSSDPSTPKIPSTILPIPEVPLFCSPPSNTFSSWSWLGYYTIWSSSMVSILFELLIESLLDDSVRDSWQPPSF